MASGILFNPVDLVIAPPLDLNRSQTNEAISSLPMRLRTDRSIGLFGARRAGPAGGSTRVHQGVDLLAPAGEPVFAVASGEVVLVNNIPGGTIIAVHHNPLALGVVSRYIHLRNPLVVTGDLVEAGQQVGEVRAGNPSHLHFELRQLPDPGVAGRGNSGSSMALDPTRALYNWEKNRFQNDRATRHVGARAKLALLEEIVRDRMLRFVRVRFSKDSGDIFLPLLHPTPDEVSLLHTLRGALLSGNEVRLVWRDSLFFGEVQRPLMKLLVEVQVFT